MSEKEATRAIHDAAIAGWITVGLDALLTLIYATGAGFAHIAWLNWLHFPLMIGLIWSMQQRSRLAAVVLLVYYFASKLVLWVDEKALIGLPIALLFGYFFWRGVRGVYALTQENSSTLSTQ
jgi:hypothetical protein